MSVMRANTCTRARSQAQAGPRSTRVCVPRLRPRGARRSISVTRAITCMRVAGARVPHTRTHTGDEGTAQQERRRRQCPAEPMPSSARETAARALTEPAPHLRLLPRLPAAGAVGAGSSSLLLLLLPGLFPLAHGAGALLRGAEALEGLAQRLTGLRARAHTRTMGQVPTAAAPANARGAETCLPTHTHTRKQRRVEKSAPRA